MLIGRPFHRRAARGDCILGDAARAIRAMRRQVAPTVYAFSFSGRGGSLATPARLLENGA